MLYFVRQGAGHGVDDTQRLFFTDGGCVVLVMERDGGVA
jgi:hypothetical protein